MKPEYHPSLVVDMDIVRSNIHKMTEKAKITGVEFRPHFKTHQSHQIGRIFRDLGTTGITVSSLKMAEYFADDGWTDITIAFPANVLASSHYNELASIIDLKTLVISEAVVNKLDSKLNQTIGLYIEIDPDYGRSGVPVSNIDQIKGVFNAIKASKHFYPAGFYCHTGLTYKARSADEILDIAEPVIQKIGKLKKVFPDLPVCFGDTPSCSVLNDFGTVDQISPGNFVFYDWMQVQIGSCSPNEIAVYMNCPIIEKFNERSEVLIHGGAVHFSKEYIEIDGVKSFGEPRLRHLSQQTYIKSISQEHGIIACSPQVFDKLNIGDIIQVFPVHSCLTADLMQTYRTTEGHVVDHLSGVNK